MSEFDPLVIYGGSFDPIHNGHLRIARRARDAFRADVVFVPAYRPRWKSPAAGFEDRVEMIRRALKSEGNPSFSLSLIESERPNEVSYTVDTLLEMKKRYPRRELILLIGSDEANSFPRWKDSEKIVRLAKVVYVPREGVEVDPEVVSHYEIERLDGANPGPVSSSKLRGLSLLDCPASVIDYIVDGKLYFMADLASLLSERRLAHSISVASLAYSIALHNKLEHPERAYQAGLLHDVGKNAGEVTSRDIVMRNYPEYKDYPSYALHQWVGAVYAREKFHVEDQGVVDAIACHCTGKPHMTSLAKIVYAADKIEPGRGYDSRRLIRACLRDYYKGFLAVLRENREFLSAHSLGAENPLTEACFELYLGKEKKEK